MPKGLDHLLAESLIPQVASQVVDVGQGCLGAATRLDPVRQYSEPRSIAGVSCAAMVVL